MIEQQRERVVNHGILDQMIVIKNNRHFHQGRGEFIEQTHDIAGEQSWWGKTEIDEYLTPEARLYLLK